MEYGYLTDCGVVREHNEDNVLLIPRNGYLLVAVADGMGGHNAGEIASSEAIKGIIENISDESVLENAETELVRCVEVVNKDIYRAAVSTRGLIGMGTTLVAAALINEKACIVNVGDSRAYVIGETIRQITRDHSYVEELRQMGRISDEEARNHPGKNQITRAVGTEDTVKTDYFEAVLDEGEVLLLASDGLTNMLTNDEISDIVRKSADMNSACRALVELANERGGTDNITVAAVKV